MKNIFAAFGCLCLLSMPLVSVSAPVNFYQEDKPKKEIKISMNSSNYREGTTELKILEGFLKQANIKDRYLHSSLNKLSDKYFFFEEATVDEAMEILSIVFDVQFNIKTVGKKKFCFVEPRKK